MRGSAEYKNHDPIIGIYGVISLSVLEILSLSEAHLRKYKRESNETFFLVSCKFH